MDNRNTQFATSTPRFLRRAGSLPILPLATLTFAIIWFYVVPNMPQIDNLGYYMTPLAFLAPIFVASIICLFSLLYIYKAVRGPVQVYAQVIAWLFTLTAIAILIYVFSGSGSTCRGFFGVATSCMDAHILTVAGLLFFNGVGAVLWDGLAFSGIIALLFRPKSK